MSRTRWHGPVPVFLLTAVVAFTMWALAPLLIGARDSYDDLTYYTLGMGAAGIAAAFLARPAVAVLAAFFGAWTGQVIATLALPEIGREWSIIAVIITGFFSLITVAGTGVGLLARAVRDANRPAARSRKDAAIEFLTLAATGNARAAFEKHAAPGFRHHNPHFRGDAASLMQAMDENAARNPGKSLHVERALEDGEHVSVFSRVHHAPGDRGVAVVHIFRFEGDCVAEMWDVGQEVPEVSVNENGMF